MDMGAFIQCHQYGLPICVFDVNKPKALLRVLHGSKEGTLIKEEPMMIESMKTMMNEAIEAYKLEITSLRTGRAHAGLLDKVTVDYYGAQTPLKQMATINVTDARMLQVVPWDKPSRWFGDKSDSVV